MDVHAVGQSANNESVRTELPEFSDEFPTGFLAVFCNPACADDADYVRGIKRGGAAMEEKRRSIGAGTEPQRIVFALYVQTGDALFLAEGKFLFSPLQFIVHLRQCFRYACTGFRQCFADVVPMLIDGGSASHGIQQQTLACNAKSGQLCQCHCV